MPSAGSAPMLVLRSASSRVTLTAVPMVDSDSGLGLVTSFAR
jgi:hypothetical protein